MTPHLEETSCPQRDSNKTRAGAGPADRRLKPLLMRPRTPPDQSCRRLRRAAGMGDEGLMGGLQEDLREQIAREDAVVQAEGRSRRPCCADDDWPLQRSSSHSQATSSAKPAIVYSWCGLSLSPWPRRSTATVRWARLNCSTWASKKVWSRLQPWTNTIGLPSPTSSYANATPSREGFCMSAHSFRSRRGRVASTRSTITGESDMCRSCPRSLPG